MNIFSRNTSTSQNIFANSSNNSTNSSYTGNNYGTNNYQVTPRYGGQGYQPSIDKLGSKRINNFDSSTISTQLVAFCPQWKEVTPLSVNLREQTLHLNLVQHRLEDYYLIRKNQLRNDKFERGIKEHIEQKVFNPQLLKTGVQNLKLFPYSSEPPVEINSRGQSYGNASGYGNTGYGNTSIYNQTTNYGQNQSNYGQSGQSSGNIFQSNNNIFNNSSNTNTGSNPFVSNTSGNIDTRNSTNIFSSNNNNSQGNNIFGNTNTGNASNPFVSNGGNMNTRSTNIFSNNNNSGNSNNIFSSNNTGNNSNPFGNMSSNNINTRSSNNIFSNNNSGGNNIFSNSNTGNNLFSQGNNNSRNIFANNSSSNNNIFSNNNGGNNMNSMPNIFGNNSMPNMFSNNMPIYGQMMPNAMMLNPMMSNPMISTPMMSPYMMPSFTGDIEAYQMQLKQQLLWAQMAKAEKIQQQNRRRNMKKQSQWWQVENDDEWDVTAFLKKEKALKPQVIIMKIDENDKRKKLQDQKKKQNKSKINHNNNNNSNHFMKANSRFLSQEYYSNAKTLRDDTSQIKDTIFGEHKIQYQIKCIWREQTSLIDLIKDQLTDVDFQLQDRDQLKKSIMQDIRLKVPKYFKKCIFFEIEEPKQLRKCTKVMGYLTLAKINLPSQYSYSPMYFEGFRIKNLKIQNDNGKVVWKSQINVQNIDFSQAIQIGPTFFECRQASLDNITCQVTFNEFPKDVQKYVDKGNNQKAKKKLDEIISKIPQARLLRTNFEETRWCVQLKKMPKYQQEITEFENINE